MMGKRAIAFRLKDLRQSQLEARIESAAEAWGGPTERSTLALTSSSSRPRRRLAAHGRAFVQVALALAGARCGTPGLLAGRGAVRAIRRARRGDRGGEPRGDSPLAYRHEQSGGADRGWPADAGINRASPTNGGARCLRVQ